MVQFVMVTEFKINISMITHSHVGNILQCLTLFLLVFGPGTFVSRDELDRRCENVRHTGYSVEPPDIEFGKTRYPPCRTLVSLPLCLSLSLLLFLSVSLYSILPSLFVLYRLYNMIIPNTNLLME